jgi:integrase
MARRPRGSSRRPKLASIRKYRTKKGDWRYHVRNCLQPKTFGRSEDAKLYKADQERREALGELYMAPAENFGARLDAFLERGKPGWRDSTYKRKQETAKLLKPLRKLSIRDVTRAELRDLVYSVAAQAPNQAEKALALAKAVLREAAAERQPVDPGALTIPAPRYEPREPHPLTLEQLKDLTSFVREEPIRRIVMVAGLTGMREGELLDLLDSDLCLRGCSEKGVPHLHVRKGKTKTAKRLVYLSDDLVAILRDQLMARTHTKERYVFAAPEGGRLNANNFMHRHFRPARRALGIPASMHDLRHTAISLMALAGWRPEHIAKQVGHSDGGALIFRVYRHIFEGEMEAQPAKLDALLREHGVG